MMTTILTALICVALSATLTIVLLKYTNGHKDDGAATKQYLEQLQKTERENIEILKQSQQTQMKMFGELQEQKIAMLTEQWEKRLSEQQEISRLQFETLSESILSQSVEHLRDGNTRQMETVLTPLRERLQSLTTLINQVNVNSTASRQALTTRIEQLASLNQSLGEEARSLTNALKGNSKVQGDWGETIVRTILEKAGLKEGINFRSQPGSSEEGAAYRNEDGALLRPDFIISLPDERKVIIDSKVSLTAYVDYCGADDEAAKQEPGKRHVASVKKHITELAAKKYQKTVEGAMEHVLMFIPNEGAYITALTLDPDIWAFAFDRKVAIVSPAHLLSTVQMISQIWRQDRQNKNAAEIARIAGLIHDGFVDFMTRLDKVGDSIRTSQKAYEETRKYLDEDNARSITRRAARLKELGAKTH